MVYNSDSASANILSFTSQIDAGAGITYDKANDRFITTPANGEYTDYFGRKDVTGSEGRFYMCDTRTMIESKEAIHVATRRKYEVFYQECHKNDSIEYYNYTDIV
jgi:hypothetical protein